MATTKIMNAALYIRVSTEDQLEYSPDAQKRAMLQFAKANHMIVNEDHIFIDEGKSARSVKKRLEFQRMIAVAKSKPKPFDVILIHKFDRFARSREDSVVYKALLRKECGIQVVSITEHIEDDKFAIILEAMLEAMAEYYSINLGEEVKKGMTEKARRGEWLSIAPFGYDLVDKQLVPNDFQAGIVRSIYEDYVTNNTPILTLARHINALGIKTNRGSLFRNRNIRYILSNPVYKGYVRWSTNGRISDADDEDIIIVKGTHEALVSEELWEQANSKLAINRARHERPQISKKTEKHWCVGLMRCSDCGGPFTTHSNGYLQCINYNHSKCTVSHNTKPDRIVCSIIDSMSKSISGGRINYIVKNKNDDIDRISIINQEIKSYDIKYKRIRAAYIDGIDSKEEYATNKAMLDERIAELREELSMVVKSKKNKSQLISNISSALTVLMDESASNEAKYYSSRTCIDKIIYDKKNEHVDVYYYL